MSEAAHPNVQIKSESDKARGKRKAEPEECKAEAEECEDTDDGECMEVDDPHTNGAAPNVTPETRDDDDDDCQITGRSGSLALSDVRPMPPRTATLSSPRRALPRSPARAAA